MSTNISKQKRDDLVVKIETIRKAIEASSADENKGNLLTYLGELEREIQGKKYGLVFEEHREELDDILETNTPIMDEQKELFIDNGGQMNFLIEGDNLACLKLLEKTHKGKIDLIYIDPPYNNGGEAFVYDTNMVDELDNYKHSKWISFMKQRLLLAKNLLSEKGCIMMSISDIEFANLRLLSNSIFGEHNFIGEFVVVVAPNARDYGHIGKMHEYALFYAKNIEKLATNKLFVVDKKFKYKDALGGFNIHPLYNSNEAFHKENRPNLYYPFYLNPKADKNGFCELSLDLKDNWIEVYPPLSLKNSVQFVWRWGQTKAKKYLNIEIIGYKMSDTEYRVVQKMRHTEKIIRSVLDDKEYITRKGTAELEEIFSSKIFNFPKAIKLIKDFCEVATTKKSTILDFFAGSGTTGHAVMKLNAEDGGNRKFILCTNNENNICRDITYERIKKVIEKEEYNASLKYYKVDFVEISEQMYYEYADELLRHIRELVELENGVNFVGNDKIAIVLDDDELDFFINNDTQLKKCKTLYLGHNVLPSSAQDEVLKANKIKINIIPDYYYQELEMGK